MMLSSSALQLPTNILRCCFSHLYFIEYSSQSTMKMCRSTKTLCRFYHVSLRALNCLLLLEIFVRLIQCHLAFQPLLSSHHDVIRARRWKALYIDSFSVEHDTIDSSVNHKQNSYKSDSSERNFESRDLKPQQTTISEEHTVPNQHTKKRSKRNNVFDLPSDNSKIHQSLNSSSKASLLKNVTHVAIVNTRKPKTTSAKSSVLSTVSTPRNPYGANYYASYKSQKLIKASATNSKNRTPLERTIGILETFLSINPDKCNASNLVCALTLSAKVLGGKTNDKLRSLLYRAIDILSSLIDEDKLSARQLCNAAWAIAKHSDRDPKLLPESPRVAALSEADVIGEAETWDLRYDLAGDPARRVDETIDKIAIKLKSLLEKDYYIAKESELCMVSWAYGILRRRRRPAGWKLVPQIGKIPLNQYDNNESTRDPSLKSTHLLKFEVWGTGRTRSLDDNDAWYESTDGQFANGMNQQQFATGQMFEKISEALCAKPILFSNSSSDRSVNTDFIPQQATYRIQTCQWSELANLVWAFASYGHLHTRASETLLTSIAREASRRINIDKSNQRQVVQSRDLAQIVWSLGTLQSDNFRLADSLVEFVDSVSHFTEVNTLNPAERPLRDWSCADIVQVASSLAHARLDATPLLLSLYTESVYRLKQSSFSTKKISANVTNSNRQSFLGFEISVLLWSQARLYLTSTENSVFAEFTSAAVCSLNDNIKQGLTLEKMGLGSQEQANIAWSLTVLEHYTPEGENLLMSILGEAASSCEKQGFIQLEHAHQLWQALCLLEYKDPEIVKDIPAWFRTYLEDRWQLEKSRAKISSARHKSLSTTLKLMGVAHFNEHDEDIDVAIVLKPQACWSHETEQEDPLNPVGMKIAVEFDGPNHFTRQHAPEDGNKPTPPRALGHTVLKYRHLKNQGWTVVRVPYYEFDKIPFWASMERQRYLQRLLKTHGNIRFSSVDVSEYKAQLPSRSSRFD